MKTNFENPLSYFIHLTLVLVTLTGASLTSVAQSSDYFEVRLSADFVLEDVWTNLSDCGAPSVTYTGQDPDCCNCAVNATRRGINNAMLGGALKKTLNNSIKVGKALLPLGVTGDLVDVINKAFQSENAEEFRRKVGEMGAGKVGKYVPGGGTASSELTKKFYNDLLKSNEPTTQPFSNPCPGNMITQLVARNDGLHLVIQIGGNCSCKCPRRAIGSDDNPQLTTFNVIADSRLEVISEVKGDTVFIKFKIADRNYNVFANCGCPVGVSPRIAPSGPSSKPKTGVPSSPKEKIVDRICRERCQKLYDIWQEWKRDAERPSTKDRSYFEKRAEEARKEYEKCRDNCYEQALSAGEIKEADLPTDVRDRRSSSKKTGSQTSSTERSSAQGGVEPKFALPGYSVQSTTGSGLLVATFNTPEGKKNFYSTDYLSPGDTLTGTVEDEPTGKTEQERTHNQAELSGYVFKYEGQQINPGQKNFTLDIPTELTEGAKIITLWHNGEKVATTEIPVIDSPPPQMASVTLPTGGQQGKPLEIKCPSDGKISDTDYVKIGDTKASILAKSREEIIALNNSETVGPTTIECSEDGVVTSCPFRNIRVAISANDLVLRSGQQTMSRENVYGLSGLTESLPVHLVASGAIQMKGGNDQYLTITPAEVEADGSWSKQQILAATAPGTFNLTVTVLYTDKCTTPIAAETEGMKAAPEGGGSVATNPAGASSTPMVPERERVEDDGKGGKIIISPFVSTDGKRRLTKKIYYGPDGRETGSDETEEVTADNGTKTTTKTERDAQGHELGKIITKEVIKDGKKITTIETYDGRGNRVSRTVKEEAVSKEKEKQ